MADSYLIERMSYGPDSISHASDGKAVFISGCAAVGDMVLAETILEKKKHINARILEVTKAGEHHCQSICSANCGGCPWRSMDYDAQLAEKGRNIAFNLTRLAGIEEAELQKALQPMVPSPYHLNYRNKVEFGVTLESDGIRIGMNAQSDDEFCPLKECHLLPSGMEKLPKALQGAFRMGLKQYLHGLFRVGIRYSERTKQCEVALWTTPGAFPRDSIRTVLTSALKPFGGVSSIVRVISEPGKQRRIKRVEVLEGKGYWEEILRIHGCEYRYRTSAPSFFQVNTLAAEQLVEDALQKLDSALSAHGNFSSLRIADLYAGGGTFSIPLAAAGAEVVAVESASSSVKDMQRNADINQVKLDCIGGDSARELPSIGFVDGLIVDPPRAGLADGVVSSIAALKPRAVVYVSCDPVTLARDIRLFIEEGYRLFMITPHDLFPQTYHVENVCLLTKDQ